MRSNIPFVRQEIDWRAVALRILLIALFSYCIYPFAHDQWLVLAIAVQWLLTLTTRTLCFPPFVHRGIGLIKQAEFARAIPFLEKSVSFYTRHRWIDRYRFLLLISSNKSTIRESTLNNLGYCHLQSGDIVAAREIYEGLLMEYPHNKNARAMLGTIAVFAAGASLN